MRDVESKKLGSQLILTNNLILD